MIATRGNQIVPTLTGAKARTISRCAFARLVSLHATISGHKPDPRDLDEWLAVVWPMVSEDMDPARWARAYLIACGLARETPRVESFARRIASCQAPRHGHK